MHIDAGATAVVVDDEVAARDVVRTFLGDHGRIALVGEAANGIDAVEVIRRHSPDLLFLDIQMPDLDGFGVLEALGPDVPRGIVLVTAHDEHAIRAFEVHAVDYLLKPFGKSRFDEALRRAMRAVAAEDALGLRRTFEALIERRRHAGSQRGDLLSVGREGPTPGRRLGVRVGSRTVLVDTDDIDWIEADGDYARVHATETVHLVSKSLGALQELLAQEGFVRIHRSILVRGDRVRELRRDADGGGVVKLDSGIQLRVARTRWDQVEAALGLVR